MLVVGKVVLISGALLVLAGWGWAQDRQIRRNPERATGAVSAESRLALVIGNSNYETGPLRNPANDAKAMAKTLRELGFEVIEKVNLTEKEMKQAIDDFGDRIENAAVRLFYYSGHGLQVDGHNFLVPIGARIKSERDVEYDAINVGKVLARMESRERRMNIVILDACRDNPYRRGFRSDSKGLAPLDAPTGTVVAYATGPGKVASDGPGNNGLYTTELIKWMQVPGLKIEDVFKRVRRSLSDTTGDKQVPWESVSLVGDFYFRSPVAGVRETATGEQIAGGPAPPAESWPSKQPKAGDTWKEPVTGMEFAWVPGGCYQMGCGAWAGECFDWEKPVHEVCVDGFWMGKTEVTQGQWRKVVGNNPSHFKRGDDYPVETVSLQDAKEFIRKLNERSGAGQNFRLPTEAEWEYACRSGGKEEKYAGAGDAGGVSWNLENSNGHTHPVGKKQANGLGLLDMSGNVWEWVEDVYEENAYAQHSRINPLNVTVVPVVNRVYRGGAWPHESRWLGCTRRMRGAEFGLNEALGFRLVRTP